MAKSNKSKRARRSLQDFTKHFTLVESPDQVRPYHYCNLPACMEHIVQSHTKNGVNEDGTQRWRVKNEKLEGHIVQHHQAEAETIALQHAKNGAEETECISIKLVESKALADKVNQIGANPSEAAPSLAEVDAVPLRQEKTLTPGERILFYLNFARTAAKLGWAKSLGQNKDFQDFLLFLGFGMRPSSQTVSKYQAILFDFCVKDMIERLGKIANFSNLPLISVMCDVWTNHLGEQVMGVKIVVFCPWTFECIEFLLPLEPATCDKLTANEEAALVRMALVRLQLRADQIYAGTTDNAAVALKSVTMLSLLSVGCRSHRAALVLKAIQLPKPRQDAKPATKEKYDQWIRGPVAHYMTGASERGSHFNQSSVACRLLAAFQLANHLPVLKPKPLAPTRWLSSFANINQDLRIFDSVLVQAYFNEYAQNSSSTRTKSADFVPTATSIAIGKLVRSAMFPLHLLDLAFQRAHLSLAAALVLAVEAWDDYCVDCIFICDERGWITQAGTSFREQVDLGAVEPSVKSFFLALGDGIEARLIDECLDVPTLINVALDPKAWHTFNDYAQDEEGGKVAEKCGMIITKVAGVRDLILDKMVAAGLHKEPVQAVASPTAALQEAASPAGRLTTKERLRLAKQQKSPPTGAAPVNGDMARSDAEAQFAAFEAARLAAKGDDEVVDDVEFWKQHFGRFPQVYHVFVQARGVKPSTAQLESSFSMAGNVVPPRRASTKQSTACQLLTIRTFDFSHVDMRLVAKSVEQNSMEDEEGNANEEDERAPLVVFEEDDAGNDGEEEVAEQPLAWLSEQEALEVVRLFFKQEQNVEALLIDDDPVIQVVADAVELGGDDSLLDSPSDVDGSCGL